MGINVNFGPNRLISILDDTPAIPDKHGHVSDELIMQAAAWFKDTHDLVYHEARAATLLPKS
jgi:hypothetical protein